MKDLLQKLEICSVFENDEHIIFYGCILKNLNKQNSMVDFRILWGAGHSVRLKINSSCSRTLNKYLYI